MMRLSSLANYSAVSAPSWWPKRILAVTTPGVVLAKPMPIPDLEIERLRRITASQYPVECCAHPQTGEIVEIPGDITIRGVLVERDSVCRVAIISGLMSWAARWF